MSEELKSHPVIAACAEHRASAAAGYSIEQAVEDARFLRRQPEAILSDAQAKRVIDTLFAALESSPAYLKALVRGQDVFVLVEQDQAAPYGIRAWAEVAGNHGTPPEKVSSAQKKAKRWSEHDLPSKKWPD